MSLTLEPDVDTLGSSPRAAKTRLRIIDCDIHPYLRTPRDLDPFLPARWRQHLAEYGKGTRGIYAARGTYPRFMPNTSRRDAWPKGGGLPGSDVDFIRTQHLDANDVEFGVLEPLLEGNSPRNVELQAALCSAFNDWQATIFPTSSRACASPSLFPRTMPRRLSRRSRGERPTRGLLRSNCPRAHPSRLAASVTGRSSLPPRAPTCRSACT